MNTRLLALILLALAVAGGGVGAWFWWHTPGERVAAPPTIDLTAENDPDLASAVEAARQRVASQPRSARTWGELGMLLLANGFGEDSRPCFAQAAQLDPKDARWPYLQGLAEQAVEPDGAVPLFRAAAEHVGVEGPAAGVVRWRYAEALMRKGERQEAGEILRDVLRRDPSHVRARLALGVLAHDAHELDTAEGYFRPCSENPLTQQRATVRLASLYQEKKDTDSAERYWMKARQLPRDPEGPDPIADEYKGLVVGRRARLLRAEQLLRDGAIPQAVELLTQLLEDHPDEAEASVKLGMALAEVGQFQQAERVLREGLARGGERVQGRYFLCVSLFHQAEKSNSEAGFAAAAEEAKKVLASKPDHAFAHLYLGLSLRKLGKSDAGLQELEQAVRCSPESVDPHLHLGQALIAAGRREDGMAHLDRAVELAGDRDPRPRAVRDRLTKGPPDK
jgi:tetratricopeptide (TPR) repeat protein